MAELAGLQASLPMLGGGAVAAGVLALLLLLLSLRKKAAAAKALAAAFAPLPPAPAAAPPAAAGPGPEDGPSPFAAVLDRTPQMADDLPLILVLGADGSGKADLLRGAGATETSRGWWAFDGGLALPVPGAVTLADSDRDWRRVLDRLRRNRRTRPLDGVVLTVAADRLLAAAGADPLFGAAVGGTLGGGTTGGGAEARAGLIREAARLWERLSLIQTELGMVVPVSVVVTQTHRITGFQSFFGLLGPAERQQMVGWANPMAAEAVYTPDWLQTAAASLTADLCRAQTGLAVRAQHRLQDAGVDTLSESALLRISGLIGFPSLLQGVIAGLDGWLGTLFSPTAYVDSLCWRGVWITGRLKADGPVVLSEDLFRHKIFPERALARPAHRAQRVMARTERMVRRGLLVSGLLAAVALVWTGWDQDREFDSLEPLLRQIHSDLQGQARTSGPGPDGGLTAEEQAARTLLDAMDRVDAGRIGSLLIPASWSGTVQRGMEEYVVRGFTTVVMAAMRRALDLQVTEALSEQTLTAPVDAALLTDGQPPAQVRFTRFMTLLDDADADIRSFNRLGGEGGVADLVPLAKSLLGYPMRHHNANPLVLRAISMVRDAPYRISEEQRSRAARMVALHANAETEALTGRGPLQQAVTGVMAVDGESMRHPAGVEAAVAAVDDLRRLLTQGWTLPVQRGRLEPGDTLSALIQRVGDNAFLGPEEQTRLSVHFAAVTARYREDLLKENTRSAGPVLVARPVTGLLTVGDGVIALTGTLQAFLKTPFMQARRGGRVETTAPAGWDPAALELGLDLYRAYGQWTAEDAALIQSPLRDRLMAAGQEATAAALRRQVGVARLTLPMDGADSRAEAFARQAELFSLVRSALTALNDASGAAGLAQASRGTAFAVLAHADARFTQSALYQPPGLAQMEYWNGLPPAMEMLYGVPDAAGMNTYLETQAAALRHTVLDLGGAAWLYLHQDAGALPADDAQRRLLRNWARLYPQTAAYFAGQASTVRDLTAYLSTVLPGVSGPTCGEKLPDLAAVDPTGDYFLERRQALQTVLWSRCDQLNGGGGQVATAYSSMAALFNQSLGGRYPFTQAPNGAGLPAVTPEELRAFFRLWDGSVPRFAAELDRRGVAQADRLAARAFITRMQAVRTFFAPWLAAPPGGPAPAVTLTPRWRADRAQERHANQILDWSVLVGPEAVPGDGLTAAWSYGEPVGLTLRWAKDSPQLPVGAGPDLTAQVIYQDPWSLVSLLRTHQVQGPAAPLLFDVAVAPAVAAGVQGGSKPPVSPQVTQARITLGLGLTVPGADGKPGPLVLPEFPVTAPVVTPLKGGS